MSAAARLAEYIEQCSQVSAASLGRLLRMVQQAGKLLGKRRRRAAR